MIKKFFYTVRVLLLMAFGIFLSSTALTQQINVYPTNWWVEMKYNHIQVMLHGDGVGKNESFSINYPGVILDRVSKTENANYVFLNLQITEAARPGIMNITATTGKKKISIPFELKERRKGNGTEYAQGLSQQDLIYLIMPDRFSNGDTTNDRVPGMRDQTLNRDTVFNRHGGDLKGVQNHLDYLQSLGVTAIWLNPVIENDMPERTEHGYAFTNHYKIDPRLGGDAAYHSLIQAAHAKGMKIIQDAVYNHVGSYHFTVLDRPMHDWLNNWDTYTNTTYKEQTIFDPYQSSLERKKMQDGWFVPSMPDLNQRNPFVEKFLIQHAIWTVEEFGIDGWRIDTYAYNDLDFMNRCNEALLTEFPNLFMFGETWVHGVVNQSYFTRNNFDIPFKSNLPGVTDFQLLWGITDAMTKDFGWTDGANKLYNTLSNDFVYKDAGNNVIFLDNHDLSRFYSVVGADYKKYKAALIWLLTCRGIPQLYYGGEIGMEGFTSPTDGYVRKDFPGGWPGDPQNKFIASGRTPREDSIFNLVSKLGQFRKKSNAITKGKMMQFVPVKGEYVYFRYYDNQTLMVAMNTAREPLTIEVNNYKEVIKNFTRMRDVLTGKTQPLRDFEMKSFESGLWQLLP